MSEEKKRFFCFPIGLLALYPDSSVNTMSKILDWALEYAAERSYDGWGAAELKEAIVEKGIGSIGGRKPSSATDCRLALAAASLNVTLGSLQSVHEGVSHARRFLGTVSTPAQNNLVQVSTQWFWECYHTEQGKHEERSLSWREFRVLCALLSKVGARGYKKCGWQEIQARTAGCCGKMDYQRLSAEAREHRAPLILTRGQIRSTLCRLEADHFFARYNHGWTGKARESWFSFSMPREDLRGKVLGVKERRREQLATFRNADSEAAADKRSRDNQPATNTNREPPETDDSTTNTNSGGNSDHAVTNPVAITPANPAANAVANINKNNSNRNDLNQNDSNPEQRVKTAAPVCSFSEEDKLRWGEFASGTDFEGYPMQGCASVHGKFREWLEGAVV